MERGNLQEFNLPKKIDGELDLPSLREREKINSNLNLSDLVNTGDSFLTKKEKIDGELNLPSLKETRKIVVALDSVGINAYEFLTGSPSIEEVQKGLTAIKNTGVDMDLFYADYPQFKVKDLDVENFLSNNKNLSKVKLPNLQYNDENFLSNNEAISKVKLPNLEEYERAFNALENMGINMNDFYFGNPSMEEIAKVFKTLQDMGIEPKEFFSGHPYLANIELDEETKGKTI